MPVECFYQYECFDCWNSSVNKSTILHITKLDSIDKIGLILSQLKGCGFTIQRLSRNYDYVSGLKESKIIKEYYWSYTCDFHEKELVCRFATGEITEKGDLYYKYLNGIVK